MSDSISYSEFIGKLASILTVSEADLDRLELEDFENYDSLGRISVSALVEDAFGAEISQEQLASCKSAKDLFELASKMSPR
jgi:acyl carrier protein